MEKNIIENEIIHNEEKKEKPENKILLQESENELYEKIKSYLGGPNLDEKGEINDISYINWAEKNEGIKHLCAPYEVIY